MALFKSKKREVSESSKAEVKAPLYAVGSAGSVKTFFVEPRKVAMIMAIVADQTDIPLNQLRFLSIKEITD